MSSTAETPVATSSPRAPCAWQTPFALFLAAAMVLVFAAVRPGDQAATGLSRTEFVRLRHSWPGNCNVVFAGDSRMALALAPEVVMDSLGRDDARMVNFSFNAVGFDDNYLSSVEQLLATNGQSVAVVLGISPHSLTEHAVANSSFVKARAVREHLPSSAKACLQDSLRWCRRTSLPEMRKLLDPSWSPPFVMELTATGWNAVHKAPKGETEELRYYADIFAGYRVSPRIIDTLLKRVAAWKAEGVAVYGLRLPVSKAMLSLENRMSGFDEKTFVADFQKAGAIWLDVPPLGYDSYDGGHIDKDEALRLSRHVAAGMAATESRTASQKH